VAFLRELTSLVAERHPGCITIAEESTAWPGVTHPVSEDGLGFTFKWNLGWMHDTLGYFGRDAIHRRWHQNDLSFASLYEHTEHFVMPLSHDEVVHGKRSLIDKMPGDEWQQFANLRAYLGFMWAHPGKKLLFMGNEIAQRREWNHDRSLDWNLLEYPLHAGVQRLVRDLNRLYAATPALYELDASPAGFEWLQVDAGGQSVFAWLRKGRDGERALVSISNLTPRTCHDYRVGVPRAGDYRECLNTDADHYGGSGQGNLGVATAEHLAYDGQPASMRITLPPLATVFFEYGE
jgi:1,4-alpha-glucan branching enzyme